MKKSELEDTIWELESDKSLSNKGFIIAGSVLVGGTIGVVLYEISSTLCLIGRDIYTYMF